MVLTGTELVLTCFLKRHWAWTYMPPADSVSELTGGVLLLVSGCRVMDILGTNFLVA
jgi:hypothetical protein